MAFQRFEHLQEPWWGKQPDESLTAYTRFSQYRDQKRGERSHQQVAESHQRAVRTVTQQAQAHRWDERAAAFDEEQTRQHRERITQRAERFAEAQLSAGEEYLHLCRKSVRSAIEHGEVLDPGDVPKWTDAAIKLRQAAQSAPDHVRAIYRHAETTNGEGGNSSAWEIDLPEFEGMSPAGKRERITEMISSISRLHEYQQREQG